MNSQLACCWLSVTTAIRVFLTIHNYVLELVFFYLFFQVLLFCGLKCLNDNILRERERDRVDHVVF